MDKYPLEIKGYKVELPILPIDNGIKICFFNLHGAQELTEHCAKHIAELVKGCDIVITAESKGLQLAHCVARNLGQSSTPWQERALSSICRTAYRLR